MIRFFTGRFQTGGQRKRGRAAHAERTTLGGIVQTSGKDVPHSKGIRISVSGDWRRTVHRQKIQVNYSGNGRKSVG